MSEEDGGLTQCVDYGEEATLLMLPVLLGATQTGGIVEYSVGEGRSLQQTSCSLLLCLRGQSLLLIVRSLQQTSCSVLLSF